MPLSTISGILTRIGLGKFSRLGDSLDAFNQTAAEFRFVRRLTSTVEALRRISFGRLTVCSPHAPFTARASAAVWMHATGA